MSNRITCGLLRIRAFFILLFVFCGSAVFPQADYVPKTIIAKYKSDAFVYELTKQQARDIGVVDQKQLFPIDQNGLRSANNEQLSRYVQFSTSSNKALKKVINQLMHTQLFEYAEPRYIGQLAYKPNDPGFANQNALKLINAEKAWDITKGNANVLIGVVDAGVDTGHADLKGKFYENTADPINGRDDDGDGYIDNFWGWDFRTQTGNIQFTNGEDHGVQMAGLIAPNTDNNAGISGIAFNCKMLAVKVTNGSQVVYGYEGIKYAADKGCKVINCSWNIKSYSQFGADMVKYATQRGALVVAATGNQGRDDVNYPAMYDEVLAVTNTDLNDNRVSNSNIGFYTDLSAPGLNVLTTKAQTGIVRNSGTSISTALVSGAAALVSSHKTAMSPIDIGNLLKASSAPLYANGKNEFYKNKLGVGRLDVYGALTFNDSWMELDSIYYADADGGAIEQTDTVQINAWFSNKLAPANSLRVVLKDLSNYAVVLDSVWNISAIAKDAKTDNSGNPFQIKLDSSIPLNEELEFELVVQGGNDTASYGFSMIANPTYRNITVNKLHTTIGSRGTFGYYEYPQKKGIGVIYDDGVNALYEGGLVIGQGVEGSANVVDRIRGVRDVEQTDFRTVQGLQEIIPPSSDGGFYAQFDDHASKNLIGVLVEQSTRAWNSSGHENYVIIDYVVKAKENKRLENLYVGLFADWDISDAEKNKANYDGQRYVAYTYSEEKSAPVLGVQLLSAYDQWKCYSIDHVIGGEGGIDLTDNDVFSKEEKFTALSRYREAAGDNGLGADVLQMLSTGPHTIETGDSLKVSFAIHGAPNLMDLKRSADSAFFKQNGELPMSIEDNKKSPIRIYPNPSKGSVLIDISEPSHIEKLVVSDVLGNEVGHSLSEGDGHILLELKQPKAGFYLIKVGAQVLRWQVIN